MMREFQRSVVIKQSFVDMASFVVVNRLLPTDGGMAEDHGAPEAEKLPRAWT